MGDVEDAILLVLLKLALDVTGEVAPKYFVLGETNWVEFAAGESGSGELGASGESGDDGGDSASR